MFDGEPLFLEDLEEDPLENDDFDEELPWDQYMMDDSLDFITKFDRYHASDIASQRLVLLQGLDENLHGIDNRQLTERILPLLPKFSTDAVPALRREYLVQMKFLAFHLLKSAREDSKLEVFQSIIPSCFDLTIDENADVSCCAIDVIIDIATALPESELEGSICQIVNLYSHDDRDEECRVTAIRIYSLLASRFNEYSLNQVVSELTNHAEDMSSYVRSTVARNIFRVMAALSPINAYTRVYQVFQMLSRDEMPEVRAACAESFVEVARVIDPAAHWDEIYQEAVRLFDDEETVQQSMLKVAGEYISLLPTEFLSVELVRRYATVPAMEVAQLSESCALSFLAVLKSVGVKRWNELSLCFTMLIQQSEASTRKIMAENLSDISLLFDAEQALMNFLPVFQYLLETEDVVKIEMATRASDLLKSFPVASREECVIMLSEKLKGTQNWRVRKAVGEGLSKLLEFCGAIFIKNIIVNIALAMMGDSVSAVRRTGSALIVSCIEYLKNVEYEIDYIIDQICCFAESRHYAQRLLFIIAAEQIHDASPGIVSDYFSAKIMQLTEDSVSNVRIRVAMLLRRIAAENTVFMPLLEKLATDCDEEVRWQAKPESIPSEAPMPAQAEENREG